MSDDKTYNGWTNYETWAVKLWLDNEEPSYREMRRMAREAWRNTRADATFSHREAAAFAFADALKEQHEEANPLSDKPSVFSDLLSAALSEVNWQEISQNVLDDEDLEEDDEGED